MNLDEKCAIGDFLILGEQGNGAFSRVKSAIHKTVNYMVAIKCVSKTVDEDSLSHYNSELNIVSSLQHPYLLTSFTAFEDEDYYYHVTELADNGCLFNYLQNRISLTENEARFMFHQILSAVEYLHTQKKIVHRDLKLENILLDKDKRIRIIDFGFSRFFEDNELMDEMVGSPAYVAPEIALGNKYDSSVDVWSMGVILYALTTGKLPFNGSSIEMQLKRVVMVNPFFPPQLSEHLIDLLKQMLQKDPSNRIKITEIRNHPWIKSFENKDDQIIELFNNAINTDDVEIRSIIENDIVTDGADKELIYKIIHMSKVRNEIHQIIMKTATPVVGHKSPIKLAKPHRTESSNKENKIENRDENRNDNRNENRNENSIPTASPIKTPRKRIFKSSPKFTKLFNRY
ncbi:AGC family protein kinase [Tritrichomonas foetus]|uniref:AGC family protein kinase n=1 Tax=Tritrichomonas foetus TaxID=1144522 RepID=A0A1J4JXX7_9EUKA|nr:AGC family protein kinase [Tritrichomonas foetus]|eukprot:OHT04009.1 AGC family protein kinase [Tritrichomonas foetus]